MDTNREEQIEARMMSMEERIEKLRNDFKDLTLEKLLEWLVYIRKTMNWQFRIAHKKKYRNL